MADNDMINRRLAAILAADVVGFSRMMGADEAGTLAALKHHRETVFDPTTARHKGRLVKLMGDGALVEFSSVVDAVRCALAIQRSVTTNAGPGSNGVTLRIGINLGDVIIDGDDIYGDGVNVAARLEPLAEPGGVCIAGVVKETVDNRIDVVFEDGGEVAVKNIDRPIHIWKWHPDDRSTHTEPDREPAAAALPSIAVLPFTNMSGDAEQEYFSDGVTEDIITDLSKVGGLMVVARNSSFAYKARSVDIRQIGRDLGVTSVLEGSIRRSGNRVRITAQLIDAVTGTHLWADRYDRDLTDIFALQDEVARNITEALKVRLTPAEEARIAHNPTDQMEAHDLFLKGREFLIGPTKNRPTFEQAVEDFGRAIELDPNYSDAFAGLALTYLFDFSNRWSDDTDQSLDKARRCAEEAVEKDTDGAFGHLALSRIATFQGDLDLARAEAQKALAIAPNYALGFYALGCVELYLGKPLEAISQLEEAMQLDPGFAQQYLHFLGTAYLVAGKYEAASIVFKQRLLLVPETDMSRALLASALGHLGDGEAARRIWSELMWINPDYRFAAHIGRLPFQNRADLDRISDGLAKVGLPD